MPPSSRVPPLLEPCIRLPNHDSLYLVTHTLGASSNWLLIRFLCDALNSTRQDGDGKVVKVIFASWMREWEFWKAEARKGGGLDMERLKRDKRLAFVDGLSALFLGNGAGSGDREIKPAGPQGARIPVGRTPQSITPARGPPGRVPLNASPTAPISASLPPSSANSTPGHFKLTSPSLPHLEEIIKSAFQYLQPSPGPKDLPTATLLILDEPSILLATQPNLKPLDLLCTVFNLQKILSPESSDGTTRTQSANVVITLPCDDALLSLSAPPQPLERDAYNFLVKTAHSAHKIISCRVLDTGVARDVSGVIRITDNGHGRKRDREDLFDSVDRSAENEGGSGKEYLYKVGGDGGVKVFERGAGGEG